MTVRRRRPDLPDVQPVIDPPVSLPEDEAFDAIDRLAAELPEGGAPFTVVVTKRSADGKLINRCKRFPLSGFEVDQIPVLFGGGNFRLWVLDGSGHKVANYEVNYDPELYQAPKPVAGVPASAPASTLAAAPADGSVIERLHSLERALETERLNHLQFLQTIAQSVIRGAAPGAGINDQVGTFKVLLDLLRDAGGARTPAHEIGEAMRMAFDMAREVRSGERPEGEAPDVWGTIMDKIGKPLIDAITAGPRGTAPQSARLAVPSSATRPALSAVPLPGPRDIFGNPETPAPAVALPAEWAKFEFLRRHTGHLYECAKGNADPDTIATFAYENVPDPYVQDLERFVKLPAAERGSLLCQLDPRLSGHLPYLETVAGLIRQEFEGEDDANAVRPGPA